MGLQHDLSAQSKVDSGRSRGVLYVLISGCCWGFHGVLIKFALGMGVSFLQVFFLEVLFATVFFGMFSRSFFRELRLAGISQWLSLGVMGVSVIGVGYFLFLSFSLGPISIGATLMFMYLPVVYAFSLSAKHQTFSLKKLGAIALILIGAVLTTQIISSIHEPGALPAVFAALAASMCYALMFIMTPILATYTTAEFRSFSVSVMGLIGCLVLFGFIPELWLPIEGKLGSFVGIAIVLGFIGQTLPVLTMMKGLPITGSSLGGSLRR